MPTELEVTLIDEKPCIYGFYRRYRVGKFCVNLVIDTPLYCGGLWMAEVYDRDDNLVGGTSGFGATEDEAVKECLTKWAAITKPSAMTIPAESELVTA